MTQSIKRPTALLVMLIFASIAPGCAHSGGYPSHAEVSAIIEPKPVPPDDIVTSAVASARYNSAMEAWGDRLSSAGARLCRFFERTGMPDLDCPE